MKLIASMFVLGIAAPIWVVADAHARRTRNETLRAHDQTIVNLLGTADLALSLRSRWLRHPSQAEWGAPFQDGPAMLDVEPGSFLISVP